MKALFLLVFTCWSVVLWGQPGNYFLTHHAPTEERFDYVCFDMAQDKKGVMYFATKAGILEFDGRGWDLLPASSAIYAVQISASGDIYWSGAKGFGKIGPDNYGLQQMMPLSDTTVSNVFQTMIVDDKVYFLAEDALFRFDPKTQKTARIPAVLREHTLLKLFELFGTIYVSTDHGTFVLDHDKLTTSSLDLYEEVISCSRNGDHYIIATGANKVYTTGKNLVFKTVVLQDQAYVDASVIVSASWLDHQLLALGTLRGGVVFVNPINGVTQQIVNYATGLPDNEVFKLMTDANHNVWVAHDYGFTKISPYVPLGSFSHYNGLQGNLLCAFSFGKTIYVGTSLGLYKLEKVDVYDELVSYVDAPTKPVNNQAPKNQPAPKETQSEPTADEPKKGGLFKFWRRNKNAAAQPVPDNSIAASASDTPSKPSAVKVKKTQKVLRSSQYVFRKVQGIDAKVTHLVEVQGKLLASGLGGLYEVNNLTSKSLMEEPIDFMYALPHKDIVIVSTYNDEVRTLRLTGNSIENSSLFNNLTDQIHHVFEGDNNELWFCGSESIYRAELKDNDVRHKQTIALKQRNTDKTIGMVWNGKVFLANTDGFYHVNRDKGVVEKIDSLPKPSRYFAHRGSIVFRDQHGWDFLGNWSNKNGLRLLNVFEDLRFMASDTDQQNLWLISESNGLYKFFGKSDDTIIEKEFPIFLKAITNQNKKAVKLSEVVMDQEHSAVKFEVVQPDYLNPKAVEFRYYLKGMQDTWSEWSAGNDVIYFPYLPTGDYTLQVEAKNIFGKTSSLAPLSFEVLPPYWKRPWFYAMEFSVFAFLVLLSFRLSTRYRIISRLLSLLTIILLIEFIQTVIGATILTNSSPVIDFFIQVMVAVLILPVEGYLRSLMLQSLDPSSKFYQFIMPQLRKVSIRRKGDAFVKQASDVEK